jgi:hypothetical protein
MLHIQLSIKKYHFCQIPNLGRQQTSALKSWLASRRSASS